MRELSNASNPADNAPFSWGVDPMALEAAKAYAWVSKNKGINMLYYSVVFFIVALVAAFLGFASLAGLAAEIAKIFFLVFAILFVVSFLRGRAPRS